MLFKVCTKCKELKPVSDFNRKRRSSDSLQPRCRDCAHEWYLANRERHIANTAKRKREAIEIVRQRVAAYLATQPCVDCGEVDVRVLDFDHDDPATKVRAISAMIFDAWSWDRIEAEIKKCVVRCANCHRRRTSIMRDTWRHRWMLEQGLPG
jgi:hypothetical protein